MREVLDRAVALAGAYLDGLAERPVAPSQTPAEVLARARSPVPERGAPAVDVLEELARLADPGLMAMGSPRFFGWVIGGALPVAVGADLLTSVWDQNAGTAEATPSAAVLEQVALDWVLELLDLPRGASAALVTGAQAANTVCLNAARHRVLASVGWDVEADGLAGAPPIAVVVGAEQHDTLLRSLRMLGLGYRRVRTVDTDDQGRMRADVLARVMADVRGPAIVCAQAGNVNTGAFDPIAKVADAVDEARARSPAGSVWFHVDGAFGLWSRASPSLRGLAAGVERASSWATDAHKWLNTPYDCGIALCADPAAHRGASSIRAAYLPERDPLVRDPCDFTPELSRRARGFVLWAALRHLGRSGVQALVEGCCGHARRFSAGLAALPGATVLTDTVLNQVLVRFTDPAGKDDDAHTRAVLSRVQSSGTCFMSGTTWHGLAAMRISVSGWSTGAGDVDRSLAAIAAAHRGEV